MAKKFLRHKVSDVVHIIPIENIRAIDVGANTTVHILMEDIGHYVTNVSETLAYKLVATTAADAAKTKVNQNDLADIIEKALKSDDDVVYYDISLTYPITSIVRDQLKWDGS